MEVREIQENIGKWLAEGRTNDDIVDTLAEECALSREEASTALREVYDGWQHTRDALELTDDNLIDWHVFLRKQILQTALEEKTVASLRLALSVLDSLATIQGISTPEGQTVPLTITLVEKKEEEPNDDTEVKNAARQD